MSRHNLLTESEGIHQPYNWVWQDAGERNAVTAIEVSQEDLLNKGIQLDTLVEYILTDLTPTFTAISGGASFNPVNAIEFTLSGFGSLGGDVNLQLKNGANENPTKKYFLQVWFSTSQTDPGLTSTGIDDFEINIGDFIHQVDPTLGGGNGNFYWVQTSVTGEFDVTLHRASAGTEYMWVVLPDGSTAVSEVLSFTV